MTLSLVDPDLPANLSTAESAELAARLRTLAESGLALPGGLRAVAGEVGSSRLAEVLRQLAARLERGESLEHAIGSPGCRLPVLLRGLILAGVQSGRLPEVLDQFTALNRRRQELRQRLSLTLGYPALLVGLIAVLLIFLRIFVTDEYTPIFRGFGIRLPVFTDFYLHWSGVIGWTILALAVAAFVIPLAATLLQIRNWPGVFLSRIPVLGPVVRNEHYVQFTRLMATLLDAQVTLPDALQLSTFAMKGTTLEGRCRAAYRAIESGVPLDEAISQAGFLDSLTCFVYWGQTKNALKEAFTAAAEVFESRTKSQAAQLNMIVLPLAYLFIITFIGYSLAALLLPFMSLLTSLSTGT
jgi:type II secretory pathway component PulF